MFSMFWPIWRSRTTVSSYLPPNLSCCWMMTIEGSTSIWNSLDDTGQSSTSARIKTTVLVGEFSRPCHSSDNLWKKSFKLMMINHCWILKQQTKVFVDLDRLRQRRTVWQTSNFGVITVQRPHHLATNSRTISRLGILDPDEGSFKAEVNW